MFFYFPIFPISFSFNRRPTPVMHQRINGWLNAFCQQSNLLPSLLCLSTLLSNGRGDATAQSDHRHFSLFPSLFLIWLLLLRYTKNFPLKQNRKTFLAFFFLLKTKRKETCESFRSGFLFLKPSLPPSPVQSLFQREKGRTKKTENIFESLIWRAANVESISSRFSASK